MALLALQNHFAQEVPERSRKFKDMRQPFGMIDQFLITVGFEDGCESLTLHGVQPPTLWELGFVMIDDGGMFYVIKGKQAQYKFATRTSRKQTQRFPK